VSLKPRVIMVGPDPMAHGGMSSVAATLLREPALERFHITYVTTWVEGGPFMRTMAALGATVRFMFVVQRGCVVHIHMAQRGSFFRKYFFAALARARGARVLLHLHGSEFHSFIAESAPRVRRMAAKTFQSADEVLVLSESWRERVQELTGRADAVVFPNPVALPVQPVDMSGPPTVVFLGRLGTRKGTPELFAAIASLQSQGANEVRWVLAGDGDVEQFRAARLTLPFPDCVSVPGWLSASDATAILRTGWILCLPSHDEGKPIALLEAMAHGLACVATPVGGIPEIVVEGETGVLVPVGDVECLASTIGALLESRTECLRLGGNGRALVAERYASAKVGRELASIYDRLMDADPADAPSDSGVGR
jgi:glycosyltransferase involved in cell wall biosynthesis